MSCSRIALGGSTAAVEQGCSTGYLYWYLELKYWYLYLRHGYWYWYLGLKYW